MSHCWTRKAVNYFLKISFCTFIEIDNHTLFSLVVALYVHRKIILILMFDVANDNLLKRKFLIGFPLREMLSRWKIDNSFFQSSKQVFFLKSEGTLCVHLIRAKILFSINQSLNQISLFWYNFVITKDRFWI